MSDTPTTEITQLLNQWSSGDAEALPRLLDVVYPELRRIAASRLRSERAEHTLQPTSLVHEDKSIPESRGCPLGYRIGAVQTFFPDSAAAVVIVLVAVQSFGFGGPSYRWLAVPPAF